MEIRKVVCDGKIPVPLSEAQEIFAILEAGEKLLDIEKGGVTEKWL